MTAVTARRIRWSLVWTLIAVWFLALAFDWGGNRAHLLLLVAIVLLIYELLAAEPS